MTTSLKTVLIGLLSRGIFAFGFRLGFTAEQEAARSAAMLPVLGQR